MKARVVLFLSMAMIVWNCAVFNRNNTPLVVKVEEHLIPEETAPKIIAAPVYIPLGLLAGLLDLFIVHPIIRIPDAYSDTKAALWTPHPENGYVTRMAFLPIVTILTPFFFTGDLLIRSSFDVNGNVDRTRIEEYSIPKETIEEALEKRDRYLVSRWLRVPINRWSPEICYQIVEQYSSDPEILELALSRLFRNLDAKSFRKYETNLIGLLNRDLKTDQILVEGFDKFRSRAGVQAMFAILSSKKAKSNTETYYIKMILSFGTMEELLHLYEFYKNDAEKKKLILERFHWIWDGFPLKDIEQKIVPLLGKDPDFDKAIIPFLVKSNSPKASEAMTRQILANQVPKSSLRIYVKAVFDIAISKDVQAILDRLSQNSK